MDSTILVNQSTVSCGPDSPDNLTSVGIHVQGSSGLTYTASILINPDVLQDIVVGMLKNTMIIIIQESCIS